MKNCGPDFLGGRWVEEGLLKSSLLVGDQCGGQWVDV